MTDYYYLLAYATAGIIYTVRGCAVTIGNGTSGCNYNDSLILRGSNLPTGNNVSLSLSAFSGDVVHTVHAVSYNSSVLAARLPYIGTGPLAFAVQVFNSTAISPAVNYLAYTSQAAVILRVTGCAVDNSSANSTTGCVAGQSVLIEGQNFAPPGWSLNLYVGGSYLSDNTCTFISTSRCQCTLPTVPTSYYGRLLSVRLRGGDGSGSSNSPLLLSYGSPTSVRVPVIYSVSGCATNAGNATSDCDGGTRVLFTGANFGFNASVNFRYYPYYTCRDVWYLSYSQLSCVLPLIYNTNPSLVYPVTVTANNVTSVVVPYVSFRSQVAVIYSIRGCADDNSSFNATFGCVAGQRIFISGSLFLDPATMVTLVSNSVRQQPCSSLVIHSSSLLSCTLPAPIAPDWYLDIQIYVSGSGMSSESRIGLLSYAAHGAWIDSVSGCAIDIGNSTALCNGGEWVEIRGRNFSCTNLQVWLNVVYNWRPYAALNVTFLNSTAIRAQLPYMITSPYLADGAAFPIVVYNNGVASNNPVLVNFTNQLPRVVSITGCAIDNGNTTGDCVAGVTITGQHLAVTPQAHNQQQSHSTHRTHSLLLCLLVCCLLVRGQQFLGPLIVRVCDVYLCDSVVALSSSLLICRLPALPNAILQNLQWLSVQSASGMASPAVYTLKYKNNATILAVRGCAVTVGNGTSGCDVGDELWIYGVNLPTGRLGSGGVFLWMSWGYTTSAVVLYNDSVISTRLPYVPSATQGQTFGVQIRNGTVATNVAYITYTSQAAVIYRVTGCAVNNNPANTTSGCSAGTLVAIDGHHFVRPYYPSEYRLAVTGAVDTGACTNISFTRIYCTLPAISAMYYNRLLDVQVQVWPLPTSSLSSNWARRVTYSSPSSSSSSSTGRFITSSSSRFSSSSSSSSSSALFYISSFTGCPSSGCSYADRITIVGSGFTGNSAVYVSGAYCASVEYWSATRWTCALPAKRTFGESFKLQVVDDDRSSNELWIYYSSQQPTVRAVQGCSLYSGNGNATDCAPNTAIMVTGSQFLYQLNVTVVGYTCAINSYNATAINCTLPSIPLSLYGSWLTVQATSSAMVGSAALLVYGSLITSSSSSSSSSSSTGGFITPISSFIYTARGCAYIAGNGTGDCTVNDHVFLRGVNLPTGSNVTVLLAGSYRCNHVVSYNATALSFRIPYLAISGSGSLAVQLLNNSVSTSPTSLLLWFSTQLPRVWKASGCAVNNNVTNTTMGCSIGTVLTIDGSHFPPTSANNLHTYIGSYITTCTYLSTTRMLCSAPAVRQAYFNQLLTVELQVGAYFSNAPRLVYYGALSSSSSTGLFVASSGGAPPSPMPNVNSSNKQGLTAGELVIVILVAVVVVGLLLVCQALYCLHHFAGFKFPRLARLTGGRLFASQDKAAAGFLLAHDFDQSQQPMLQAMQLQPPAASPYQPALHQLTSSPSVPAPSYIPPSSAPVSAPVPHQQSHSLVSSQHYYQPAS